MTLKICSERENKIKLLLLLGLEPQTLNMVGLNANHYTRTDDTNVDEIITIRNKNS